MRIYSASQNMKRITTYYIKNGLLNIKIIYRRKVSD